MSPPPSPKTTDRLSAEEIARGLVKRLEEADTEDGTFLAAVGTRLLVAPTRDWTALLTWTRSACEYLGELYRSARKP